MSAERLGTALESSNLAWSDHQVKDIDFVTASGMARPELGVLLIRAYASNDPVSLRMANWLAIKKSRKYLPDLPEGMRRKIVNAAIQEFLVPICTPCGGTGKSLQGQKWGACPTCAGTRIKRYTNGERAKMIGVDTLGSWEKPYADVLNRINDAYYAALMGVRRKMGRT